MKIVFCDIDGVLNNPGCYSRRTANGTPADPKCIAALNRILQATGARIVLSSTWRIDGMEFCNDRFAEWGVVAAIFDVTPQLDFSPRGHEIDAWLKACEEEIEAFVILDDTANMYPHLDRLILTEESCGLTEEDADRAIAILLGAGCNPAVTGIVRT
ncbi:MAG TPA: HAD domain-containing protein [Bryobacteraceae bacterium]|nr:HAD domain-containing protein [Bryobacteraceae bacterium]